MCSAHMSGVNPELEAIEGSGLSLLPLMKTVALIVGILQHADRGPKHRKVSIV